jgi:AcrR family transcriptional regulator
MVDARDTAKTSTPPRVRAAESGRRATPGAVGEKRASARQDGERQRLSPAERRRHLIEEATAYFAEVGFGGSTRELAKRVGVTQPLLYRYFPTKADLIQAVYDAVYLNRWRREWTELLENRALSLQRRLQLFYRSYYEVAFTREWMRIYLFSGLKGVGINKWYISFVETRLLVPIVRELYAERGHLLPSDHPFSRKEIELGWSLHGAVFYHAVRKHIYAAPVYDDRDAAIDQAIAIFLQGAIRFIEDEPAAGPAE